ncbi:MAG: 5'-nucleotidase C-terminal domain-containing protein [Candidatus Eisenbacteria bacterium]|nr:5'-nucleotidase C-terminal domain-containing protein [Candidatus Eisenbacteria bacterium]
MSRLGTISAFALAALALLAAPAARAAEEAHLTVLHTTDLHGALTAWDYVSDRAAPSGLSRIATLVKRARAEGAPLLLLDAGDALQGSPLEAIWHERGAEGPEPMMAAMSRLGYDAMAVGNHEFSYGPDARRRARADATFPWLAANIVGADGTPAFAASVVRTAGALKVGIVGITTPATPALEDSANLAGLRFVPAIEAAQREVERLRGAEHCDVVVLLAHTGYEAPDAPAGDVPDENIGGALARRLTGVDLVILGHTHTVIPSLEVGTTLVTQAGSHASRLGRVDLTLTRSAPTERWTIASRKATVTAVRDSVAPDPDVEAAAKPLHDLTRAALAETLAFAAHPIAAPRGRLEDGALWELIQRAQLDATGADVSLAALPDPTLRLAGAIRRRDVMGLYPYDNTLGIVTLTGAELLATLERSARYLAPAPLVFVCSDGERVTGFKGRVPDRTQKRILNAKGFGGEREQRSLYCADLAHEAIKAMRQAVLVEGEFDCLVWWSWALSHGKAINWIALGGTSKPSPMTFKRLHELGAETVLLALDDDQPGHLATAAAVGFAWQAGLEPVVIQMPSGCKDPDDVFTRVGPKIGLETMSSNLWSAPEWLVRHWVGLYPPDSAAGVARILAEARRTGACAPPIALAAITTGVARAFGLAVTVVRTDLLHAAAEARRQLALQQFEYWAREIQTLKPQALPHALARGQAVPEALEGGSTP